jgi:hypothetical protein
MEKTNQLLRKGVQMLCRDSIEIGPEVDSDRISGEGVLIHSGTKMIESLPDHIQKKLLDEITPIISEALDQAKWEAQFQRGSARLAELGEEVKDRISKGGAEPMDFSKL